MSELEEAKIMQYWHNVIDSEPIKAAIEAARFEIALKNICDKIYSHSDRYNNDIDQVIETVEKAIGDK